MTSKGGEENDDEVKLGRPRLFDEAPLEVYSIRISCQQARLIRKIGGGNLSKGVRALLSFYQKHEKL